MFTIIFLFSGLLAGGYSALINKFQNNNTSIKPFNYQYKGYKRNYTNAVSPTFNCRFPIFGTNPREPKKIFK